MLEKVALILLGVILSALGYLAKRHFERRPISEKLDLQAKLLSINRQMNEQGLTASDLQKLELVLTGRGPTIERHIRQLELETRPLLEKTEGEFLSQAEMNQRAGENLETAKARMAQVSIALSSKLGDLEKSALLSAQEAWENYSVEQAEATAISYRGGSIYSLIFLSELESLTVDRTARLQTELDELIRLGN